MPLTRLDGDRAGRMVIAVSRCNVKPPAVIAIFTTPRPTPVARSVVAGRPRSPGASVAPSSAPPSIASGPSVSIRTETGPAGRSILCSITASRASSPGARNRGSSASATTGSRTVAGLPALPTFAPCQATAMSRTSPLKSGMSSATIATPSAPACTGGENRVTVRIGMSGSAKPPSSPPCRSSVASPSAGAINRPQSSRISSPSRRRPR